MVDEDVVLVECHPKPKFLWRITEYKHAKLYTLINWSGVRDRRNLPPEYINYHGEKFWDVDDDHISLAGGMNNMRSIGNSLSRGTVLEEDEYTILIAHLQAAASRLKSVNWVIKDRSEIITVEV